MKYDLKEIFEFIQKEVKRVVKEMIEDLALEERAVYLEEYP